MPGRRRRGYTVSIDVDRGQCKACGICIALCSRDVYDRDPLGYPIVARPEACTACMLCDWHCPDFAIEVTRRPLAPGAEPASGAAPAGSDAAGPEQHDEAVGADERESVSAAVKTAHKTSGVRRELPPDAEPRGSKEE